MCLVSFGLIICPLIDFTRPKKNWSPLKGYQSCAGIGLPPRIKRSPGLPLIARKRNRTTFLLPEVFCRGLLTFSVSCEAYWKTWTRWTKRLLSGWLKGFSELSFVYLMKKGKNPASSNAPTKTIFRSKERRCRNLAGPQQGQGRDHGGLARCNYIEFQSGIICVSFALVAGRGSNHSNWRAQTQIGAPTKRWLQKQTQISFEGEPLNKLVSALGEEGEEPTKGHQGAQNQATIPKPQLPIFRIGRANGLCILNRPMPRHMGGSAPCVSLSSRSTETSLTAGPHFKGSRKQVNLKSTLLEPSLPKGTSDNAYVDVSLGDGWGTRCSSVTWPHQSGSEDPQAHPRDCRSP